MIELKGFDALTVATAPNASSFPITIVGIDEPSFASIGRQWPWPRSVYARLVDALAREGAILIALDLQFSEADRGGPAEDEALAEAIRRAGNVVLAADMVYTETAHAAEWMRVDPLPIYREAGAVPGFASILLERDGIPRRMPREADAFWREIARKLAAAIPDVHIQEPRPEAMIRYAGPVQTFQYVSFYQALDPSKLPPGIFKDQVVIVCRHVRASPEPGVAVPDVFTTPFTASTGWYTPGGEIHANILETALRGDELEPVAPEWTAALVVALVALCAALMRRWRPLVGAAIVVVVVGGLVAADWALFTRMNLWLPVGAPIAAVVLVYGFYGLLAFLAERRRRTELRRAFSLYVSPEVVDHVMANPGRLMLGGERRDVTLLFTDLKGFTTLSEQLGADQVTRILQLHFTGATGIVKQNRGTVVSFIGDAVFAMWGAPLDDADHALHAVRAAIEMQADIARLRTELEAQGLPPIAMRIGIHTANVVVGNMGSGDRFQYTAMGDGVNLASRLEGVNKMYGTGILVSGAVAALVGERIRLRPVDRVVVKGKTEPVEIFTPCEDGALCDDGAAMVGAYRERHWDACERLCREVLGRHPGDRIAELYLERLPGVREVPPAEGWNAAVELEKL